MGLFFSFDGIDGVGKTTQIELFRAWLERRGRRATFCRDPGSTPLGEKIRAILLKSDASTPIDPRSEMLLYMAARAQLVQQVIRPALAAGECVVSDRYLLANIVYQGHAGGLDVEQVRAVGNIAVDGVEADCTFLLDMDPARASQRIDRSLDRVENRGDDYRQRLREGFLAEAKSMGDRVHVIDADRPAESIHREICALSAPLLSSKLKRRKSQGR